MADSFDAVPAMSSEHFGPIRVIALALVSTSAWLSITLLPYEVSTLSVGYHVGTAGAGWIAAAELLAVACAASLRGAIHRCSRQAAAHHRGLGNRDWGDDRLPLNRSYRRPHCLETAFRRRHRHHRRRHQRTPCITQCSRETLCVHAGRIGGSVRISDFFWSALYSPSSAEAPYSSSISYSS